MGIAAFCGRLYARFLLPKSPGRSPGREIPAGRRGKRIAFQSQPPPAGGTMYIHKMGAIAYEAALAELARSGHKEPLRAYYSVDISVNDSVYRVSMQPENHRKIAVLQAVHITAHAPGIESCELLTAAGLLNSLFNIWLSPLVRKKNTKGITEQTR